MSAFAATTDLQKNVSGAEANAAIGIRTRVGAIQRENASVRRAAPRPTAEEAFFPVILCVKSIPAMIAAIRREDG